MTELEMLQEMKSRHCEVMILSNPPHVYFHDDMSSRQRRRHERTRAHKGRK